MKIRAALEILVVAVLLASGCDAQVKTSQMPGATSVMPGDEVPPVQGRQTVDMTPPQIAAFVASSALTWTAPQNFTNGAQVNLLGIGAAAGAESGQVQYLQEAPGPTIAELLTTGTAGQVATLWSNTSFSKELELCLDIAASDCAGETIPGAAGDGHLWSTAVLHVIGFSSIEFENASTHLASISSSGLASLVPVVLPMSTVAALPACNAGLKGGMAAVSDATAPAYNASLTGGGAMSIPVYCNGSSWTAH
jgi:hypothetical protein